MSNFVKKHLICLDSDGCVMDTMRIKHERCFGPCLVNEWGLWRWEKEILRRWNEINLYAATRGINRFKGLALILQEIDEKYQNVGGMDEIIRFAECSKELSARALQREMEAKPRCVSLKKAFLWSKAVDRAVAALPSGLMPPFPLAKDGIADACSRAEIAVVSSAGRQTIEEEWQRWGLMEYVGKLCAQDTGSKAECLAKFAQEYGKEHVLMCGDSPGDLTAAKQAGVAFYPILVGKEKESWAAFPTILDKFLLGKEWGGEEYCRAFWGNLRGCEHG